MNKLISAAAAICAVHAVPAYAATDWCAIYLSMQGKPDISDQVQRFGALGCDAEAANSAHYRSWKCEVTDGSSVKLVTITNPETAARHSFSIVAGDNVSLKKATGCLNNRLTPAISFEPKSVVYVGGVSVLDPISFQRTKLHQLRFSSANIILSAIGTESLETTEQLMFGYKRPTAASGRVEIAGKDIVRFRASDVVKALNERGSAVTNETNEADFIITKLTPPIGLQGVSEITITHVNDHVVRTEYAMKDLASYTTMLRAMESKYGASLAQKSDEGCDTDGWSSFLDEDSSIFGQRCNGSNRFQLINTLMLGQLVIAGKIVLEHLKESDEPHPVKPSIDRDNF